MIDFSKLHCPCRSGQLISNFCEKQQCQLGLCASCICIHTQSHMEKGTSPLYQNIRDTYKKLSDDITKEVQQLDRIKGRIGEVQNKVAQKRVKVKETIQMAKQEALSLVRSYFEQKQEQMLKQIEVREKKEGLHCQTRLDALKSGVNKEISNLVTSLHALSEKNFLQSIPKIKTQTLHNARIISSQISSETKQNQLYNTSLNYNKNILSDLTNILGRSITLTINKNFAQPQLIEHQQNQSLASFPTKSIQLQAPLLKNQSTPIFTLRRPASQGSLPTYQDITRKENQPPNFSNVCNPIQGNASNSFVTPYKSNNRQNQASINKISVQVNRKEPVIQPFNTKAQAQNQTRHSYQLTFGNLPVKDTRASLDTPSNNSNLPINNINNISDKVSLSRVSQQVNSNKSYNAWFVSDYQDRQINNSIKKMEKRSNLDQKHKKSGIQIMNSNQNSLDFSKDYSNITHETLCNQRPHIYRTQFL